MQSLFSFPQNAVHFHNFIFICSNKMFFVSHALQYLPGHLKDREHCVMAALHTDRPIYINPSHTAQYYHFDSLTLLLMNTT